MKIILNADVPNLGEEGDIKEVKSGYARNYLLPHKLVLPYNNASLAVIEGRREAIEKRRQEKREAAMGLKQQLEAKPLAITMTAGRNGKLFGSVNSATIVKELEKQGIAVERKAVEIPEKTIKSVGNHKVTIKLYDGETAQLTVSVTGSSSGSGSDTATESTAAPEQVSEQAEEASDTEASEKTHPEVAAPEAAGEESSGSDQDAADDE